MAAGCITTCRLSSSSSSVAAIIRGFKHNEKHGTHGRYRASLIMNPESFEVGRLIGSYGFMNVTSYSDFQSRPDIDSSLQLEDVGGLKFQDVREGSVQISFSADFMKEELLRALVEALQLYSRFIRGNR